MRQILLLGALLMMAMVAGYAQEGFKISGQVANMPDGTVWLLGRMNSNKLDTLANTQLKAGFFELSGQVESGCLALIVMTDGETGFQLMVEKTNYTLVLDKGGEVKIEGGVAQSLFRQFDEVN